MTDMSNTFHHCTSLTQAPEIPNGVTDMSMTFYYCTSLTQAPEIPNDVTDMSSTFYHCTSLTGNLIINATLISSYNYCLLGAATNEGCNLVLSGSCPQLLEIYENVKDNANITLK